MVSVIIPTLDAGSRLGRLLLSLRKQTIPMEVIVVDSSSTDNTAAIAKDHNVTLISIDKKDFNHGATRNAATLHAKGDIFVFLTQDCLPYNDECIGNLVKPLKEPDIATRYGRQIPRDDAKPTEQFARYFNYPEQPTVKGLSDVKQLGIKTFFFSNVFSAIRRKEFEELGGFPDNVVMFEDMIYAAKLIRNGYRIAYVPEAKVIHSHNYSLAEQFKRYFYAGVSFKKQPRFLEYAKADQEGVRFLKRQVRYLLNNKAYRWVPYAVTEAMVKYLGYKLGLNYDRIPYFYRGKITGRKV
jgi:rhamnosyltransferase